MKKLFVLAILGGAAALAVKKLPAVKRFLGMAAV